MLHVVNTCNSPFSSRSGTVGSDTMEAARLVQAVHDGEAEAALCGALGEEGGGRCVVEGDEGFVDAGGWENTTRRIMQLVLA